VNFCWKYFKFREREFSDLSDKQGIPGIQNFEIFFVIFSVFKIFNLFFPKNIKILISDGKKFQTPPGKLKFREFHGIPTGIVSLGCQGRIRRLPRYFQNGKLA
jgi:hypothetical protein